MYVSYLVVTFLHIDPYLSMFITGAVMFVFGYVLQKTIFNKLLARDRAREPISVLLFTAGLGMVMSNLALIIFTANPIMTQTAYMGQTLEVGQTIISVSKLISFVIAVCCTMILYFFLLKTETGRALRATSQNRTVARLMGINEKWIFCLAFGIGLGLVGISAALLIPYFPIAPTVGQTFSLRTFIIVVLGGKGSVMGALVGGLIVGVLLSIGGQYLSMSYAEVLVFLVFVGVLLFKPSGLLSKEKE